MNLKRISFFGAVSLLALSGAARTVGLTEARSLAADFFAGSGIDARIEAPLTPKSAKGSAQAPYYVFNSRSANGGFVIIAGDDRLGAVLGYSDSGSFDPADAPDGLKALMELYELYMANATEKPTVTQAVSAGTPVVEPLLADIAWGQDAPFNALTPSYTSGTSSVNYYTGCVVTAATQIMKFYNYPSKGTGSKSYTFGGNELSANFGNTTYNWNSMPGAVPESVTTSQKLAYSTLAFHFGVAVEMQYAQEGSGAYTMMVPAALRQYFGYDSALRLHTREYYNSAEWLGMIKTELNAGRPVYYGATSDTGTGGHAFVCDGYDSNDFVHINWGWYGRSNGYFLINHLDPTSLGEGGGTGGYNRAQEIITGIMPARAGSVPAISLYGATRLSAVDYGSDFTLMTFIENLDTEAVNGKAGAVLVKDNQVVKVLGSQAVTVPAFAGGRSGSVMVNLRGMSTNASGVADGDDYRINMGYLPDGRDEWIILRHPIGLPAYIEASVKNGVVKLGNQHQPAPNVVLLDKITTDGDVYAAGAALFHLNIDNRSADYRLDSITVRLTSVENPSVEVDVTADVNIYDLSSEELDLLMQLPASIAPGEYSLTAFEKSFPQYPFDDSEVGRNTITVLPAPDGPVVRLTGQAYWQNSAGAQPVTQGEYLHIIAPARNYGVSGTASLLARLVDTADDSRSYIFLQQNITCEKGQSMNLQFSRKAAMDPGNYRLELFAIDAQGTETPLAGNITPTEVTVTASDLIDIEVIDLQLPTSLEKGERVACSLTYRALRNFTGPLYLRLRQLTNTSGEIAYMGTQSVKAGEEKTLNFNYRPAVEQGVYMPIVETRPSGVSIGNETPAAGFEIYGTRTITVIDLASIGGIAADSDSPLTFTVSGDILEVNAGEPVLMLSAYDLNGRLVASTAASEQLAIGHLSSGIYSLEVRTASGTRSLKIKK